MPAPFSHLRAHPDWATSTKTGVLSMRAMVLGLLAVVIGCTQEAPIITYRVPTKMPAALTAEDTRMIAAILPQAEQGWFFKVMGRKSAVDTIDETFRDFVQKIEFRDGKPILDELPDGWRRGGEKAMRFASVDINTPTQQLDLSISSLSKMDTWPQLVDMNVNRWRKQVGLQESDEQWAGAETMDWTDAKADAFAETPAIWVDVTGRAPETGPPMMAGEAPFASMAGNSSPMSDPHAGLPRDAQEAIEQAKASGESIRAPKEKAFPSQPAASTQNLTNQDTPKKKTDPKLDFDRPDGWRDGRMSMMRMAAFNVGPDDTPAEVTVMIAGGDLRANVARWIGQVRGSTPADEVVDAALENAERQTVSGRDAQRFILTTEDTSEDVDASAIDATIVPLENNFSLFIKMTGPAGVIAEQDDAMKTFLKSLKYTP